MPGSVTPEGSPPPTGQMEELAVASQPAEDDVAMADVDANPTSNAESKVESNTVAADPVPTTETTKKPQPANLEDLFDDADSDDDEFPMSGAPVKREASGSPDIPSDLSDFDPSSLNASDPEIMRSFYQRLFPWRYLFQWLNHSPTPTNDFGHREFAFTLQNDAYLRYQSFMTSDQLRKDVLRLMPSRFEIGPVYTANPRDRKTLRNSSAFKPLSKELCFDIDLTDYDDIRTCCDKANICAKCWQFMTMAIKVIDVALREDFGFKHIMWVYSGRRGAHAWVCDKKARAMDDQKRRAIAGYLEVLRGGAQSGKKVNLRRPLHPHIVRSLDILKHHFQTDVLEGQDPWRTPAQAEKLLALLPDPALVDALRKKWYSAPGRPSSSKWADIDAVAKTLGSSSKFDARNLLDAKQDIVLEYTYPRLDIEVSKKLNHLLKSPFVVHPGTGRVCVPITFRGSEDEEGIEGFDPLGVPTVQGLIRDIDAWKEDDDKEEEQKEGETKKHLQDWEKTGLKPYIDQFRTFVMGLMKDERDLTKVKRERAEMESVKTEGIDF